MKKGKLVAENGAILAQGLTLRQAKERFPEYLSATQTSEPTRSTTASPEATVEAVRRRRSHLGAARPGALLEGIRMPHRCP